MKTEILARVRSAIGKAPADSAIAREYRQTGTLDESGRLDQFIARLEDYNAGVYRCTASNVAATVAEALTGRNKQSLIVPPEFPHEWLPAGAVFLKDHGLTHEELDTAEGVLTGCTVAVSLTGTIVLSASPTEGRRALTLIPDYHLCIVQGDQVVETVPEGLRQLKRVQGRPITTISGPSATADIEMTRIKGVHGPRFLDVILVARP